MKLDKCRIAAPAPKPDLKKGLACCADGILAADSSSRTSNSTFAPARWSGRH